MSAELDSRELRVRFRKMTLADVDEVIVIERASYAFPWSDGIFRDCVKVGYFCRVVEFQGVICGYGIMSFAAGEAHVLNVCVREDLREHHVGRSLMTYLLDQAREAGMEYGFLEVRPSNAPAVHLYESMGFQQIGRRKGYYQAAGGREDALVYRLPLLLPG